MVVCCRFREMASRDPFEALRYLQVKHHLLYPSSLLVFCECLVDRFTHSLLHEESNSQRGPPPPFLPASLPPRAADISRRYHSLAREMTCDERAQ